jgi:tripartite ATP-independent transporter DctM subunit
MTLVWIVVALLVLLALRVPVAFAILIPCMFYVLVDPALSMGIILQRVTASLNSFPLLAVPLFILVGFIAEASGMADRLIRALLTLFSRIRGSLGYVNVAGSLTFSWMSGSATADAAAMGSVMVPAMKRNGYDPAFATGLTAAGSMIGPIMPPSVGAIIYAVLASVSVGDMFIAGVVPAFVIAAALFVYVWFYARKRSELTTVTLGRREKVSAVLQALPVLVTPVIILGGILGGVFTATEAAAVAAVYLIVVGFATRWMTFERFRHALSETAATTARVMLIATAGGVLGYVLARENAPAQIADALLSVTESQVLFLLIINVLLLVLGTFLEPAPALLITVPVILPVALEYGIDPVHLGIIVVLNLSIGLLTPPVGLVLYVLSNVGDVPMRDVVRGTLPAMVPLVVTLLIVTYIPSLALFLPELLK